MSLSDDPSGYYAKCLDSFRFLFSSHKALPNDLSCKSLYLLLFVVPTFALSRLISEAPLSPLIGGLGCGVNLGIGTQSADFWGSVVAINRWAWLWRKSRHRLVENRKKLFNVAFNS